MRNVEVQALVKQLTDKATAKLGITQDYVLGAIVERLEVARKGDDPYAVYKGAELPGRHLKLFTNKQEHSGLEGLAEAINKARMRAQE